MLQVQAEVYGHVVKLKVQVQSHIYGQVRVIGIWAGAGQGYMGRCRPRENGQVQVRGIWAGADQRYMDKCR